MDGDRDRDTYWNTGLNSLGPNGKQREGVREQGKQNRGGLHLTMDGDRDGDPHWSTASQDREGCIHPLIQGD